MPQLPVMTVVTPWLILHSISGSLSSARSSWVWVSTKPGASARPVAADLSRALDLRQVADRDDAVVLDREVAARSGLAAAVDQQRAADDEIGPGIRVLCHESPSSEEAGTLAASVRLVLANHASSLSSVIGRSRTRLPVA